MKQTIQTHFEGNYQSFYGKYLENVRLIGGDEYMARCPFPGHEDREPSFNFNTQNGKFICRGCSKKGHIFHFYAKLNGLDTRRDFRAILQRIAADFGIPWQQVKSRIAKTYDYVDANGKLISQTIRYEPKEFKQRRPDGNGSWIWNIKGVEPVLYQLPEVLKAQEVFIVEGEKDCDALAQLGFAATTCPMGAKKWGDHYNKSLRDKHVVLIPDNDNEGREHMTRVGASLNGIAASLKWIDLPDLPSKGDVSDFIAKYKDKEQAKERLSIMVSEAKPYTPPKQASLEDVILTEDEFHTVKMPDRCSIIEPWLKEQSISLIPGWRGVGKTWFAMGMLDGITRGKSFGPWQVAQSPPCLYLEGEMPAQDIRERFYELNPARERKSPLYVYSDAYANSQGVPRANLLSERWRTEMKSILLAKGVKLWVVDNIASLASGVDENLKRDWDPINAWLLELRFAGIATLLLHHTNKEGGQRGTSAREDNIDTSILLKHPPDYSPEDGARFIASFKKSRVRTQDLPLISDYQFQLTTNENGQLVWTWGNVKQETKVEILRSLGEGLSQKDVADTLGVDKGYVSRVRKQAVKEGHLTPKNKLTQSSDRIVHGSEI